MTSRARKTWLTACLLAVSTTVALTGCATSDPTSSGGESGGAADGDAIIVGSFAFPESEILGEIYAQALEGEGFDVTTKFNIGPRQQTIPALQDGSINLIPEYNGNLLAYYDTEYAERTTEDVDAALPDAVGADDLQVLDSAEAEDKDAYVVTKETADDNNLKAIGDLKALEPFSLASNPQFGELGYGIPGLRDVYGVGTEAGQVTFVPYEDFGGPDTVQALVDGTVQVADIYTTSPAIKSEDLVVLDDPENMISAQNVIPLLSKDIYTDKLAEVLNGISAKLTTDDLIELRDRVEGDEKASAATAAEEWLTAAGLLDK
ncbi:glycine/betaine ABC transporter substrate-binding protein [Microbacterium foliorum]|uniref:Putative osmoprotectant uptake system substrate-binding protein OsmF n=1 Tax=Microbacterium foliorum TaxID=104336 RepID=A0A0F0KLP5_9MICO|nr:ABC transporter substrate-binding protein [Microbacterium foliorum]AXL13126.1 glycine/betaine ABC transporter substrate-binding protein [Microbacterium foliorum]KJL21085.1 putative osmoprotectant uptake system substrate-binding protein OsmF precursor [Microbacterium foliorum]